MQKQLTFALDRAKNIPSKFRLPTYLLLFTLTLLSACSSVPSQNKRNVQIAAYPVSSALLTKNNTASARKILFIGNSILYWHEVPKVFTSVIAQLHPESPTKIAYVVGNSYSLKDHWDAGTALEFINKKGPWDYVILQDHTGTEFDQTPEESPYITAFINAIRQVHAQPLLFQTYVDDVSKAADSEQKFQALADTHLVPLLPVGRWWNHLRRFPGIELNDPPGGHHPSLLGSYLIALVTVLTVDNNQLPVSVPKTLRYENIDAKSIQLLNKVILEDSRKSTFAVVK